MLVKMATESVGTLSDPVYEEVTADVLGKIGPWQWMVTFIATLLMLPHFTTYCDDLFLLPYQGGHICVSPYNSTNLTNLCYVNNTAGGSSKCVEWKLLFLGYIKLKRTWLIYCQEEVQLLYVAIISRSGMLCGAIVFGLTADRFGRHKIILISVIGQLPLRLLRLFTSSSIWFRVTTFFTSMFSVPTMFLALIVVCEISSNKCRTSLVCVASLPYFWSMAASVPLARILVYTEIAALTVITLNIVLLFIVLRYLPESPSWLLFNDKNQNAELIISKAAIRNKIQLCSDFKIRPVDYNAYETLDEETNYSKLFSKWNILKMLASLCIIWLFGSFIWSQLLCLTYAKDNHDSADMSFLPIITVIIISSWFLPILYPNKLEHRFLLGSGMFLTGLLTLGLHYSHRTKSDASDYLEIGAFTTTSVAMSSMINITPRLVAVNIRCSVTGLLIAVSQVGIIAGYLVHCFRFLDDILFTSLITTATFLIVVSCYLLPKVEGRELPDVIRDMDTFGTTAKPLRWACQRTHSATQEEVELAVHSMENSPQYKDLQEHVVTAESPPMATRSRFFKVFRK